MKKYFKGAVWLASWLVACGGALSKPTAGGESHFLNHCSEGCGALDCVADLCTKTCSFERDSCFDVSPGARCTMTSTEPGSAAVCDVACSGAADCASLGSRFACEGGFCRNAPPAAGMGGTTSELMLEPASAGSGDGPISGAGAPGIGMACVPRKDLPEYEGLDTSTCAARDETPCVAAAPLLEPTLEGAVRQIIEDCSGLATESSIQIEFESGCAKALRTSMRNAAQLVPCVIPALNAVRVACADSVQCFYEEKSTLP